jgi:SAM-dependent methyltransferase
LAASFERDGPTEAELRTVPPPPAFLKTFPRPTGVMATEAEIHYVANLAAVLNVSSQEVDRYLSLKPFVDPARSTYLLDIAQIMTFLPPPPARLLDLGCGSGWTSELFARSGYEVLGVDVAPEMIRIARRRTTESLALSFEVRDYEAPIALGAFDAVVLYDALHHAQNEGSVIASAFRSLRDGGIYISIEPGVGHSATKETLDIVAKLGTTEKDMPFERQAPLLLAAGFSSVRQFLRLSQLVLESVTSESGRSMQRAHFDALFNETTKGLTSVVVASKGGTRLDGPSPQVSVP